MRRTALYTLLVVVAGLTGGAANANAEDPSGTWKWSFTRNNETRETTLKLKLEGDKLSGSITGRDNTESPIADASFKDGQVAFSVTRERDGRKFTIKYAGKLEGDTIKGTRESERNGEKQTRDWEAKRSK